ncbi:TonB-dependent receptor [Chryseolinea sp. H1M3-3]|uniref:TonB-dependent receptor n=1 Tax=Chryseolinea sp. H1M3-3 TaxID=3034144 RepID=UPI0023EC397D|nr:TonB-dependent receptor [Chryseolinea sp. H1M3-3]
MRKFLFVTTTLLFIVSIIYGQTQKVFIKGDFYNRPLLDFIHEVEKNHGIQFHYVNDVVDGILLTGVIKFNTPLLKALEILLKDKPVSFASYQEGQIILFANEKKAIKSEELFYKLSGQITDKSTGQPLPYVTVHIPGAEKGTISNENGEFEIKPLSAGQHLIHFSYIGYAAVAKKINLTNDISISIALEENSLELPELIITPSAFEITTVETPLTLAKEEILHSPNMSKDIYRTLKTLPGIANNDYSAKARIRGGHSDETGVYLDHFLINDPFHLEEVDGSFSIFNTDYVNELSVLTGGFSANYTDRLSGILDVKTSDQLEADRYQASVDLMNISGLVQKRISDKVNIFVTARRGYLDFLLREMNTDDTDAILPRFSDVWAKVAYNADPKHSITFNFLAGRDNFRVKDIDDFSARLDLQSIRNNINGWANWKWFPSKRFSAITTIGYQSLDKDARFLFPENISQHNIDQNNSRTFTLTNTNYWKISNKSNLETGIELKTFNSHYRYVEERYDVFNSIPDNIIIHNLNINRDISGFTNSFYTQYNWTSRQGLIAQLGLRASVQSFSPSIKWAPRLALSYSISPSFTAKAAWGVYYQPDLYFKLRTSLSQETPYRKNSESIHYTASLIYSKSKTDIMVNVYYKNYNHLFDDYRYEFFNRMGGVNILDIPFNTSSGFAKGFEVMMRQAYGKRSMLSVSYTYAESKIRNASGNETYREFDQPHTIIINNAFRLPKNWNISLLWTYHTGYPYTPTQPGFVKQRPNEEGIVLFYEVGDKNSKRLPEFHTLDLRMEKTWHFRKNALMIYLNVVNFYNRENLRSYWWFPFYYKNGSIGFDHETQSNIPFFVSPGVSFTLY